jgi:hypothetical protein
LFFIVFLAPKLHTLARCVIKTEQQIVHELALARSSSSLVKARAKIREGAKASINITQCARSSINLWEEEIYSSAQNF